MQQIENPPPPPPRLWTESVGKGACLALALLGAIADLLWAGDRLGPQAGSKAGMTPCFAPCGIHYCMSSALADPITNTGQAMQLLRGPLTWTPSLAVWLWATHALRLRLWATHAQRQGNNCRHTTATTLQLR